MLAQAMRRAMPPLVIGLGIAAASGRVQAAADEGMPSPSKRGLVESGAGSI
jgi:hypothetical protein